MEFREVVRRRHMVRRYDSRPVPRPVLERILEAGRLSPTAGFTQGVSFVVLEGEQTVPFWAAVLRRPDPPVGGRWDGLRRAPVVILPLADPQAYLGRYAQPDKAGSGMDVREGWPVPYWDIDAAFATMAMLLAATDEGLGALFFAVTHQPGQALAAVGAPDRLNLIGALTLGYPAPRPGSARTGPRQPATQLVRWGHW
jgi:nitroreductase